MSSKNKFLKSEDKTYWIGYTQKNEEFWFDGEEDIIKYIMKYTWRKTSYGYYQNSKGEKLHRVVMKAKKNEFVVRINENRYDNRKSNLRITKDEIDFCRRKKCRNKTGIVGMLKRKNSWCGNLKINGKNIYTKYKSKDEAMIDLLIAQQYFNFHHNSHMYYLLENVSDERKKEVLDNVIRRLNEIDKETVKGKNTYILSDDKTHYKVIDNKGNSFYIDAGDKEKIEKGLWRVTVDKQNNKPYVHGFIVEEGKRIGYKLHRYIMGVLDKKYKKIQIDHLDGNGLNNRKQNLVYTNVEGNATNKIGLGYSERKDSRGIYRAQITIKGKTLNKTFYDKIKAREWYLMQKNKAMAERLEFKTLKEVDLYLKEVI